MGGRGKCIGALFPTVRISSPGKQEHVTINQVLATLLCSQVHVHFDITSPQLAQFHEEYLIALPNDNIDSGLTLPALNG